MSKKDKLHAPSRQTTSILKSAYNDTLRELRIELVKPQTYFIECDDKILIILEGRDATAQLTK